MKNKHLLTFALTVAAVWGLGTNAYIYFFPHLIYNALEKAIVQNGIGAVSGNGSSGIPVNTLYAMPYLASPSTAKSSLLVTGTNHDTLYTVGVLDLSKGPEVLHVPDMADRYYSVEFVNSWGDVFAYVGRRPTGTQAGDYLISGPGWRGEVQSGVRQISSPDNTVLLIGRVLVESDSDLSPLTALRSRYSWRR